jgi:hypothetical protein
VVILFGAVVLLAEFTAWPSEWFKVGGAGFGPRIAGCHGGVVR